MRFGSNAVWCALLLAATASSQVPENALANWVEQGVLSADEAVAVEEHVALVGMPVSKEEVAAIPGLSAASADRLAADPQWMRWTSAAPSGQRNRITALWDFDTASRRTLLDSVAGPGYGVGFRAQRSGHWGLRIDRGAGETGIDHVAGYVVAPSVRGIESIWGDHIIRWGQGLVGWSASAFDGMRSATAAQRLTQPARAILAGDALPVRRGLALRIPQPAGSTVLSLDLGAREARVEGGVPVAWYRDGQHRTPTERQRTTVRPCRLALLHQRNSWGTTLEIGALNGTLNGVAGVFAEGHRPRARWAAELAAAPQHFGWTLAWIAVLSKEWDGFLRWERPLPEHPAAQWGDVRTSTPFLQWGVESKAKPWEHFFRWEWRKRQLTWEHQSRFSPSRHQHYRLRTSGTDGLERVAMEARWEGAPAGVRVWAEWVAGGGWGAGWMWSWQPAATSPKWQVGWSWGALPPGQQIYRLEPTARSWQTAVLSGESERRWVQGTWKLGRHWKVAGSWSHLERDDVTVLPGSGPWGWKGKARSEWRMRLAYSL